CGLKISPVGRSGRSLRGGGVTPVTVAYRAVTASSSRAGSRALDTRLVSAARFGSLLQRGPDDMTALPNVVLVHGAWADGSSWSAVTERLQADGYNVTAPQFPMNSLANNVDRLRLVLSRQNGPTIVAGHSYGGQIMTALGTDAPNVVGLVYIA